MLYKIYNVSIIIYAVYIWKETVDCLNATTWHNKRQVAANIKKVLKTKQKNWFIWLTCSVELLAVWVITQTLLMCLWCHKLHHTHIYCSLLWLWCCGCFPISSGKRIFAGWRKTYCCRCTIAAGKLPQTPNLKTHVCCEIQKSSGERLNQHCVNSFGKGLNVIPSFKQKYQMFLLLHCNDLLLFSLL